MDKKEYYGRVSFTGQANFSVESENEENAEKIVFEDIQGMELLLKDGTKLKIDSIDWDLISKASTGNVSESYISDFEIQEQK